MIRSNSQKNISVVINAYDTEKHSAQIEDSVKRFDEIIIWENYLASGHNQPWRQLFWLVVTDDRPVLPVEQD